MRAVADLFTAEAGSFQETMMTIRGSVGFRIPVYQRPYDWDRQHLQRLAQDCLNGFHRTVISREDEYTFLGTDHTSEGRVTRKVLRGNLILRRRRSTAFDFSRPFGNISVQEHH